MADVYVASDKRYDKMMYNRVGKSGLKFPAVSLGFWHNFGSRDNYDTMKAMCRTAFDAGITQFDLANNYGPVYGSAEENAGRILTEDFKPYRDELVVTSKAGYDMWPGPYGDFGSKKYLTASLDQSLKRLKLDYVDIFYHHRMDPETPLEETMEALAGIVHSGKALYAGVSNYDQPTTERAVALLKELHCPFIVNQRRYSIFDRGIENDGVKAFCKEAGVGIIAFSPLAQGLLTDKYLHGIPADSRIARDHRFLQESALTPERLSQIERLNKIASDRGQTLAQMALSWILKDDEVCSVLIGASRPEQILENISIVEHTDFTAEELRLIDEISK
ncbi:MAG: aldo/keto reductase [Lachnospiraceae bacterium]|nr:aldo/keto reductase [Lachnospiraceae bacterium]